MNESASVESQARCQRGATSVEYAIVASLIVAIIVVAVVSIGNKTGGSFDLLDVAW